MSLVPFQQIKKVPVGFVRGFQSLRPQLKTLICTKSLISLNVSSMHSLFILASVFKAYPIKLVILSAKEFQTCYFLACQPCPILFHQSCTLSHIYLVLSTFSHSFSSVVSASLLAFDLLMSHQFFHVQYNCSYSLCWVYGQTSSRCTKTFVKDVINTHDGRD